jgi:hypothetical protein
MTETAVIIQKSFQEKMKERIKDSISELMTDEELKDLVNRGLEEAFFHERKVTIDSWGHTEIKPPFLHEILKELMKESVDKHVSKFIDNHPDVVINTIKKIISLGSGDAILQAISNKFQMDFSNFQMNIEQRLNNQ